MAKKQRRCTDVSRLVYSYIKPKRKLGEEKVESQSEKKAKPEEEQKGVKKRIDQLEGFAKKLMASAG